MRRLKSLSKVADGVLQQRPTWPSLSGMATDPQQNYFDMLAGKPHSGADPYLFDLQARARAAKARLDAIDNGDIPARMEAAKGLFSPDSGPCVVLSPFNIEYGRHVTLGEFSFVNIGATFLDAARITLGKWCAIAPNVQFITDTHPVNPMERFLPPDGTRPIPFRVVNLAYPITLGDRVWVGAGAIILPGVTVGDGAMIAAGSVVTRDVPEGMVVGGNPARVIKPVDDPSLHVPIPDEFLTANGALSKEEIDQWTSNV